MMNSYLDLGEGPGDRPFPSPAVRLGRCDAHHQRRQSSDRETGRSWRVFAADGRPLVSGSSHGGGFSASDNDRTRRGYSFGKLGADAVVYFPWDVDRTFWEVLDVDHGKLLRNAVLWATNEPAPVSVKGAGVLDLSIWPQKNSMTVHLVNLTNPMMMKGPVREIIPVPRQQVRILIPHRAASPRSTCWWQSRRFPIGKTRDSIDLEIPAIDLHEVIAIDFAS